MKVKNQRLKSCNLIYLILISFLVSCKTEEQNSPIKYDNIIIFSDLSNRLDRSIPTNLPANDTIVINRIIDFFILDCVKPGIKNNDRSSISYSFLNPVSYKIPKSKIDLEEDFPNISDIKSKQAYVNNTCKTKNIKIDAIKLKNSIRNVYTNYSKFSNKYGLDILNLLNDKIKNSNVLKSTITTPSEFDSSTRFYKNHLFVFTDGYLEYQLSNSTSKRYFGYNEIRKVRELCVHYNITPDRVLEKFPSLKLPKQFTVSNNDVSLYIMETNDRNNNRNTGSNIDISDNDILKAVWKHWAKESGFKKFVWCKINLNINDYTKNYISNLVRIKKGFND